MSFTALKKYEDYEPLGVKLPTIKADGDTLERLELDPNSTPSQLLRALCDEGFVRLQLAGKTNMQDYTDRMEFELSVFEELGFVDYILLNWDVLVNFCQKNNIFTGDGRGSAPSSLVLYLLGVTKIDPLEADLFFERFVSKSRAKTLTDKKGEKFLVGSLLPDVDSDISFSDRAKVIEYIETQHKGKTSKILTFNTFSSKLCIKECAKFFGRCSEEDANHVSNMIPKLHGQVYGLEAAVKESPEFEKWVKENEFIFKQALRVEGLNKNVGVHPSGIAICHTEIDDVCPLQKTKDGDLVSAYDMNDVADLMVKFDILGLRTLTVVDWVCQDLGISFDDIDPNDEFIYQQLQNLEHPAGLFQISADTNFGVTRAVQPMNLGELSDTIALGRPATLQFVDDYVSQKLNPEKLGLNDALDDILAASKNTMLYQESMMQAANLVFGMSLEDAELLRRVVGKKKVEEIPAWKEKIYNAAAEKGLDDEVADYFWSFVEAAGAYGFNRSHSRAYANLAAKTVYLKYKYPAQFFTALLKMSRYEQEPLQVVNQVHEELVDFGIKLLPPSLKTSNMDFSIEDGNIRYGLGCIKGVSDKTLESLVTFRGSSFSNKVEVFNAAKECGINITVLAALIQAGVLGFGGRRTRLVLEAQCFNLLTDREKRNIGRIVEGYEGDLLNTIHNCVEKQLIGDDNRPIMPPKRFETFKSKYANYKAMFVQNKKYEKLSEWYYESQLLGYSFSRNLLDCFDGGDRRYKSIRDLRDLPSGASVHTIALLQDFKQSKAQSSGNKMCRMTLTDFDASTQMIIMDNKRNDSLSEFLETNEFEKDTIWEISAGKSNDMYFVNLMRKIDTPIFMKVGQVNK